MNRFASIDVGTNSVLLLVADRLPDGKFRAVAERCEIARLGRGVQTTGRLSDEAIALTTDAIVRFVAEATALGAGQIVATATSAARDAQNGQQFLDAVKQRCDLSIQIIRGEEEAALSFASAAADFGGDRRLTVIDIGGGSTEFIFGDSDRQIALRRSFQIGSVRMTERFLHSDPPLPSELAALREQLIHEFASLPKENADIIGVAGTVTTMFCIANNLTEYDPSIVHGSHLRFAQVHETNQRLAALPLRLRMTVEGLQPKRADVIVAGGMILEAAMAALGADAMTVSDHGLRWGLLTHHFGSTR